MADNTPDETPRKDWKDCSPEEKAERSHAADMAAMEGPHR